MPRRWDDELCVLCAYNLIIGGGADNDISKVVLQPCQIVNSHIFKVYQNFCSFDNKSLSMESALESKLFEIYPSHAEQPFLRPMIEGKPLNVRSGSSQASWWSGLLNVEENVLGPLIQTLGSLSVHDVQYRFFFGKNYYQVCRHGNLENQKGIVSLKNLAPSWKSSKQWK